MNRKIAFVNLVLGAALAASAVTSAQAATVTYSQSYGPTSLVGFPVPVFNPISLAQFDPSLGALQGVVIDLDLSANASISLENFGAAPAMVMAQNVSTVGFTGAGITPFSAIATLTENRNLTAFDGVLDLGGTSGFSVNGVALGQAQFNVAAGNFGIFTGNGSYNGTLNGNLGAFVQGISTNDFTSGFGSIASGTVSITYTYTPPAAVPEPATWLMMIAGFGAVGATMRRRARVRVAAA